MPHATENKKRAAGILLPVSCLPSPYGIGSFGADAYRWVDFLAASGQRYWQVLPLGPTSYGDSPYQSFSAFAGSPYYIDLELLCGEGLLTAEECASYHWGGDPALVDYNALFHSREQILHIAFSRFKRREEVARFRGRHTGWIEDYALYMAVKVQMDLRPWTEWEEGIRLRHPDTLARWRDTLRRDIDYHVFVQYLFFRQWHALKAYANRRGVEIIGDIPIYIAMDSADAWANSSYFLLDKKGRPIDVAGVPPDAFSADGQLWGNPLYRWDVLERDGYRWWLDRLHACLSMYDVLRIDHFRGFESYYAVPYGDKTAAGGEWRMGPGKAFIDTVNRALGGDARIIAEDLGYLTDEVRALLATSGYPGMKILQFAFDSREESDYMPHTYQDHCVVYTGTHDNDTVRGWFSSARPEDVALARDYLGLQDDRDGNWAFIRAALGSVAELAIIPLQDYLDVGSEARINIPSTVGGRNWCWRMAPGVASPRLAQKIARLTKIYGR